MYQLLHVSLGLEAIALLYATFDKRIQMNLISSRVGRHIEIEPLKSSSSWHITYYLSSLSSAESITLCRGTKLTSAGLDALAALKARSLSITQGSLVSTYALKKPFSISLNQTGSNRSKTTNAPNMALLYRFPVFFPHLEHLYVNSFLRNLVADGSMGQDSMDAFVLSLPPTLKTLHFTDVSHWLYRTNKLPSSLTDLRLSGNFSPENKVSLPDFLATLPNIVTLHLSLISYNYDVVEWTSSSAGNVAYEMPPTLVDLALSLRSADVDKLSDPFIFAWKTAKLHSLKFSSMGASRQSVLPNYDLHGILPSRLMELSMPLFLVFHGNKDAVMKLNGFPRQLLTLHLGLMRCDKALISCIAVLPHLQTLTMQPSGARPDAGDWGFLPRTLTHLELREFAVGRPEIMNFPTGLTRLVCHTPFFEDARAILDHCPLVKYTCELEVSLLPLNMTVLLNTGIQDLEVITTYALLRHIYAYLGPRCSMNILFDRTLGRTISGEKLLLSEKNHTIVVDTHLTLLHGYSLKGHHFSLQLVHWSKTLTALEFQSVAEISNFKFVPPNLTSLHLRRSPIKNGISMRDMPESLTSLTSLIEEATRVGDMPDRKQLIVLNTPCLSYTTQDFKKSISDHATYLTCKVSWMWDKDLPALLAPFLTNKSAAFIALDVVIRTSGSELPSNTEYLDYHTIKDATTESFKATGCIRNIEFLPPSQITLPPSIGTVSLLWNEYTPSNLVGFDNMPLPSTLTFLEVHLARDASTLIANLPPNLTHLHIDTLYYAKHYVGNFPEGLESLHLTCQLDGGEKHDINYIGADLLTLPRSLTSLYLKNCAFDFNGNSLTKLSYMTSLTPEERARRSSPFKLLSRVNMHSVNPSTTELLMKLMPNAHFNHLPPLDPMATYQASRRAPVPLTSL